MSEIRIDELDLRPVVAFDIDGVLLTHTQTPPEGFEPTGRGRGHEFYNPRHAEIILPLTELVRICYISSHMSNSHEVIGELLGLPELNWVNLHSIKTPLTSGMSRSELLNHERRSALDFFFPFSPILWCDDDIGQTDVTWAQDRQDRLGQTTIAHGIDTNTGLQPIDQIVIDSFVSQTLPANQA